MQKKIIFPNRFVENRDGVIGPVTPKRKTLVRKTVGGLPHNA